MAKLTLISHHLCPYVQRAVIAVTEKEAPFTRTYVDLARKPDWFKAISPLGKVPLLRIDEAEVLFESAVICDYLDETIAPQLHPADPIARAKHRAWIEFASATLNDIWGYYVAPDAAAFEKKREALAGKFAWLERALGATCDHIVKMTRDRRQSEGQVERLSKNFGERCQPVAQLRGERFVPQVEINVQSEANEV